MTTETAVHPHRRIAAKEVRRLCGDVSDMSLWRWVNDPQLGFPTQTYIAKRRYWLEKDVIEWLDAQASK
jgi:predicted DNA-binding transcriptional regulator AlpA